MTDIRLVDKQRPSCATLDTPHSLGILNTCSASQSLYRYETLQILNFVQKREKEESERFLENAWAELMVSKDRCENLDRMKMKLV